MTKNKDRLIKTAAMTDIHFGAKSNSELHNQDCLRFVDWFCEQVKKDPKIDNVVFMGDWYENRSALNVMTLNYSYRGAKKLNDLGLPVYFIIGNHDLYHRHTRELYSPITMGEFDNFRIVNEPQIFPEIGQDGALLCPYLFHEEYKNLVKYTNLKTWWGHFEFQGFIVTGHNVVMPNGPSAADFTGPTRIFSGHFHKRQIKNNIVYIGNTFPTTFGDAGDNDRGMAVYEHETDKLTFKNWADAPKYIKTTMSDILDNSVKIVKDARVKCIVDVPISFEESTYLRQNFIEKFNLREFTMDESREITAALTDTQTSVDLENIKLDSVDDLVIQMLTDIDSEHIDNNLLIEQYQRIKI
jgi:DNA repair exonuclease SbcCD nuclease subunit